MSKGRSKKHVARPRYRHMSIRLALQRLQVKTEIVSQPLLGNFALDCDTLTIGADEYTLVKVPGDGDCAFHSMAYIVHAVVNSAAWTGHNDAYEAIGLTNADDMRRALDVYRADTPRDGDWGDQFDWVVFCAMFGITVHIISYHVTDTGVGRETHSLIGPDVLGSRAFVPAFVRVSPEAIGAGLHAYVCNHYNTHYDPMRLVGRG